MCGQYSMEKYSGMLANGNAKYKVKKSKQLPIVIKYLHTLPTYMQKKGGNGKKMKRKNWRGPL